MADGRKLLNELEPFQIFIRPANINKQALQQPRTIGFLWMIMNSDALVRIPVFDKAQNGTLTGGILPPPVFFKGTNNFVWRQILQLIPDVCRIGHGTVIFRRNSA